LPASFSIKLKNTGNTIVQPYGNIYIQRTASSLQPLAVLPLNANGAYILPGTSRALPVKWQDGFPLFVSSQPAANAKPQQHLQWDWGKAQNFRFGHYTAKLVAVYNDGHRDVPVEAVVGFWVIPWKLLLIVLAFVLLLGVGVWTIIRRSIKLMRRKKRGTTPPRQ
jgi:hypothetical protein